MVLIAFGITIARKLYDFRFKIKKIARLQFEFKVTVK